MSLIDSGSRKAPPLADSSSSPSRSSGDLHDDGLGETVRSPSRVRVPNSGFRGCMENSTIPFPERT